MRTIDDLSTRLGTSEGLRRYFGLLGGKRARASVALLERAEALGVTEAYTLDHRIYDGSTYFTKAIGTRGDLDEKTLSELTRAADGLPLGTLRYEGSMAPRLPYPIGSQPGAGDIHSLSRLEHGILVYPVALASRRGDASHAFWLLADGEYYVEPIDDRRLRQLA